VPRITRMTRMVTFTSTLVALAWLGSTAVVAAERLSVTGSLWPPYLDTELPNGGLAADIVRTALTRAGYEIEPNIESWSRAYQGTAVGVYDVVAAVWQNEARDADLLFSDAYLLNDIVFLARKGVLVDFDTLDDLKGLRIGVVREYAYDDAFDSDPELARFPNNHLIQNLLLLRQGRLDVVVGDKWSILYQISYFMPDDLSDFYLVPKALTRRALRLGVSRQNGRAQEIADAFDAAVAAMKEDGSFEEIVRRHTDRIAILPGKR
jgi:polar amino acid transport system substrate-binding protein